jgi:hypothetical protein
MVTGAVCKGGIRDIQLCIQLSDRLYLLLSLMFNIALTFKPTVTCQILFYRPHRAVSFICYHSHETLLSNVSEFPIILWKRVKVAVGRIWYSLLFRTGPWINSFFVLALGIDGNIRQTYCSLCTNFWKYCNWYIIYPFSQRTSVFLAYPFVHILNKI